MGLANESEDLHHSNATDPRITELTVESTVRNMSIGRKVAIPYEVL